MVQVIPTTRDMSSRVLRKVVSDFQMPQKDIKSDDTRNIELPTDVSLTWKYWIVIRVLLVNERV